ncbi:MAG: hydrogenase maturation nickel metallochaperone HypA [Bryobacteraceae bacterium]
MHELSIAIGLVEAAEAEMEKLAGAQVLAIHLKLGRLSGVAREALEFSYEIACQDTPLKGSRLVIEDVPVLIDCPACKAPREVVSLQWLHCAVCGAAAGEVLQGRELQVAALEIAENRDPQI